MSERLEFVLMAEQEGANVSALCRRFGVSRACGYKWRARYRTAGEAGLGDRSRRPQHSPNRTAEPMEQVVLAVRGRHPAWGGRKLRRYLVDHANRLGIDAQQVPAASTITAILRRHGALATPARRQRDLERFERERPNELWQMDFKGDFALERGGRCFPLTLIDDHSRFAVGLHACGNQTRRPVTAALQAIFRRYGLPEAMLMDNGLPWGMVTAPRRRRVKLTRLTGWLIRLGIRVIHSRPRHPQTHGKNERFNRTLKTELLRYERFGTLADCQQRFDRWRDTYNLERPHEALGLDVPAQHYRPSAHPYPERLPPIAYASNDAVRRVDRLGLFSFRGTSYRVGKALAGQPIAIRPTPTDGRYFVYYCNQMIRTLHLRPSKTVNHVPEHL